MTRHAGHLDGTSHVPVMLREVLGLLAPRRGGTYVDCTVGAGGHAAAILAGIGSQGTLIGMDRDPAALEVARRRLGGDPRVRLFHRDYREIGAVLRAAEVGTVQGILADLGVSSLQLEGEGRGFSFLRDEPLDMRMDPTRGVSAAEWLASRDEASLRRTLAEYGEEPRAARVARALVRRRRAHGPLRTTGELAAVARAAAGRGRWRIDPATRTFQAIRIAVNDELRGLADFVEEAALTLEAGGRLVVISFHSLEDRQVKQAMRRLQGACTCPPALPVCACGAVTRARGLTPRPLRPADQEVRANPRARSARLRALERLPEAA